VIFEYVGCRNCVVALWAVGMVSKEGLRKWLMDLLVGLNKGLNVGEEVVFISQSLAPSEMDQN